MPYQLDANPTKCRQFNSWHQYLPCWKFLASWLLVSYYHSHLESTSVLVDTRLATKRGHGENRLKGVDSENRHQLLADE